MVSLMYIMASVLILKSRGSDRNTEWGHNARCDEREAV